MNSGEWIGWLFGVMVGGGVCFVAGFIVSYVVNRDAADVRAHERRAKALMEQWQHDEARMAANRRRIMERIAEE